MILTFRHSFFNFQAVSWCVLPQKYWQKNETDSWKIFFLKNLENGIQDNLVFKKVDELNEMTWIIIGVDSITRADVS